MSKMKFKLNRKGVAELMKSSEMNEVLRKYAGNVASNMESKNFAVYIGKNRSNIRVQSKNLEGNTEAMKGNKLLKSLKGKKK